MSFSTSASAVFLPTGTATGNAIPVAIAVAAYLPETAPRILAALGQPDDLAWEGVAYGRTAAAEGVSPAEPLFPRVELETAVA